MKGIAIAGTLLVDSINVISSYPKESELTQITETSMYVGGCVPNVGIDLKKLSPKTEIKAIGKVGKDKYGEFIVKTLKEKGVEVEGIKQSENLQTSFTQVMSIEGGTRTFFTYAGASSKFGYEDIDFEELTVKMFHLGYFLLLDKVDNGDGEKILKRVQEKGIKTSIDLVSENSTRYKLVIPCLKYTDNLIINEVEAGGLTGIEPTFQNMPKITQKLREMGVKERVIVHAPTYGVCHSEKEGYTEVPSYDISREYIVGTTGAGDAFCAGALLGIYREKSDKEILEMASSCALKALSTADATSGMVKVEEIESECKQYKRREKCL